MPNDLFNSRNLFDSQALKETDTDATLSLNEPAREKPAADWNADPLKAWMDIQPSTIKRVYLNDPLIREAIDLQLKRDKHPAILSEPPKESIVNRTEDGSIYTHRAARTDAERLEIIKAIKERYDG